MGAGFGRHPSGLRLCARGRGEAIAGNAARYDRLGD